MCELCGIDENAMELAADLMVEEFPETTRLFTDRAARSFDKWAHLVYSMPPAMLFRVAWTAGVLEAAYNPDLTRRGREVEEYLSQRLLPHGPH